MMDASAPTVVENDLPDAVRGTSLGARFSARPAGWPVALVVAGLAVAVAFTAPTPIRLAGAAGVVGLVIAALVDTDVGLLRGRVAAAAGLVVLTIADAGVVDAVQVASIWRPLAATVAYPVLGRALLRMMSRYRLVRPTDVIAEAVLVGAAAAIAVDVGIDRWVGVSAMPLDSAAGALPALLVGLDVALLVVVVRSITSITSAVARREPIAIAASIVALLVGHLVAAVRFGAGETPGPAATIPISLALVTIGIAALYSAIVSRPPIVPLESPLFSAGHAGIVVASVLAAPAVLGGQLVWDTSASAAVAIGSSLIGVVLASHVVSLMYERASSEHQATHDALTGLPNRLLFMDRLERAIAHASRNDTPVAVLYIDLDRFKDVNDTLGHDGGDHLLRQIARRLIGCARDEDTVARLGGDEFAVLLPHLAAAEDVVVVADRVLAAMREPVVIGKHTIRNGGSIGVAVYPYDGSTSAQVVNAADAAMYRAKDGGGSMVELFSAELHRTAVTRLEIETALYRAIVEDQLVLHYQPIVEASDGRTCGAEALVRWNHPQEGLLQPGSFIPIAEQSELIVELGNWVILAACKELARFSQMGCGDRFVTVNVSPRHFHEDLVSSVTSALRETGADPTRLVVELTETAVVEDVQLVAERLRELRRLGVRAAIDDFGTGYCGLQYLGDLPVSTLKLDRSFVQAMTPRSAAIVAATIAMARSLGLTLVAEGVETEEQRRFLERNGCDRMQGYHLGRPMPADDFVERVRAEDLSRQPEISSPRQLCPDEMSSGSVVAEPAHS